MQIHGPWKKFITAGAEIVQDCEVVHDRMCGSDLLTKMDYFWFNVTHPGGCHQEWTPSGCGSPIAKITEGYMRAPLVGDALYTCVQKLISKRIYKLIWTILMHSRSSDQHCDY